MTEAIVQTVFQILQWTLVFGFTGFIFWWFFWD